LDFADEDAKRIAAKIGNCYLLPALPYGNAQEHDMEFGQFVIMFNSIFREGFSRPHAGVRQIIDVLVKQFTDHGGELRLKCGVKTINVADGRAQSVLLDNGEVLVAQDIISSAGLIETMILLSDYDPARFPFKKGQLSFVEFILVLNKELAEMGYDTTITFFSTSERFNYRRPHNLVDVSSGVICCPNNFQFENPLPEAMIRVTNMANFDLWNNLSQEEYQTQKTAWLETTLKQIVKFVPDFRDRIVYSDMFTPKTIYRFTGHLNGAVYGTPNKIKTGRTHLDNLFICGTDQGFLGIVGAMLSGISMANLHILQKG
jgi:phytoene dehydrogenase-like protein